LIGLRATRFFPEFLSNWLQKMSEASVFQRVSTIDEAFRAQVAARPNAPALVFEGSCRTFAQLDAEAARIAAFFAASGFVPGDRVAWWGKNHADFVALLLACARSGVVLVVVNWRLALREVEQILADAAPKFVMASEEFAKTLSRTAWQGYVAGTVAISGIASLTATVHDSEPAPCDTLDGSLPFLQLYTSGTTGIPKGVPQTHANHLAAYRAWAGSGIGTWGPDDRCLIALPVFHAIGSNFTLYALLQGACVHMLPEFLPDAMRDALASGTITRMPLVPTLIYILANDDAIKGMNHQRLKTIIYGGASITLPVLKSGMDVFGCDFTQVYAATETTAAGTNLSPEDHLGDHPPLKSCGRAQPGVELAIFDNEGTPVPTGSIGEIAMRGQHIMQHYWNRPGETAKVLRDGWYLTGDAGHIDDSGLVTIVDRTRDMMISGGENIYPSEVESVIREHPVIAEAAVFGVPDARWGHRVAAALILRPDAAKFSLDDMRSFLDPLIARYKHPRQLLWIDALPRNATGKILRGDLIAMAERET
jgi:acyl-CoA synthetase (AMP-forming)/AMP-acid ligase II